jgi:hypothetical protein
MVTQIPDLLLKRDDTDQRVYNHVPTCYPITYGKLREALCNNKKEGIKFINYLLKAIESTPYMDVSLAKHMLFSWTGIPAENFSCQTDVSVFITDSYIAGLLQARIHSDESSSSDIRIILEALLSYKQDLIKRRKREDSRTRLLTKDYLASFIEDSLEDLSNPSIHLLTAAWKAGLSISNAESKTANALSVIEGQLDTCPPGLYNGAHGIARNLAVAIESGLLSIEPIYIDWINQLLSREENDHSLKQGMAGYGIANLACSKFIPLATFERRLKNYTTILAAAMPDNSGFATGLAGITHFLLSYAQHSGNKKALQAGLENLICLTERAYHKAGTTHWISPYNNIVTPWNEDGASHTSMVFMKAYELTGSIVYKRYVEAALYAQEIYATHDNLSEYATFGNILLNAHQSLKEHLWFSRSTWIVQVTLQLRGQTEREKEDMLQFLLNYYNQLSSKPIPL